MTKEEYKENLIRMWDSVRKGSKGKETCSGVSCLNCPFNGELCNAGKQHPYEIIEVVENWAKEHPIATIDDIRDWTPKADVVERSKIDKEMEISYRLGQEEVRSKVNKAVKEIIKLSPTPTAEDVLDGNPEKDAIWGFLVAVLNILKKI